MERNNQKYLGDKRICLLEQIDVQGSLTTAAKAAGLSYKAAWDALNAMNNLADHPLTVAATGGSGGGGTCLTEEGKKVVKLFRTLEREHLNSLAKLEESLGNVDHYLPLLKRITMRISAKNVFSGVVSDILRDVSVAQIVLTLKSGHTITAVIGNDSVDDLNLNIGSSAYALVKASSVMIADPSEKFAISAKNLIRGRISNITESAVLGEVIVDIGAGESITATITDNSVKRLKLKKGGEVCAVIKATSVIIGVE
ncbi:MAG: TOBE domain-containing protein [Deltaproteobacteria bacterium]|nr:TOBE domain-containing protein [Deltaproteobacteria bacterium]MCW9050467.1 TOBE domain-containing protein [Deltaproteobacteria bacterium]